MKNLKSNLLLYIIILIFVLAGAFLIYKMVKKGNTETKLITITEQEFENKIANAETFILVVSQTGCSHCEQYLPELERTLKEVDLNAYVLNITNLSKEESIAFNKYVNFSGTPTTIFFNDGVEKTTLNRLVGYASKTKIKEKLKAMGYIK